MTALDEPLRRVVGDPTAKVLAGALDVRTVGDLLRHYPRRYYERGELADLGALRPGEHATVQAEVVKVNGRRIRDNLYKTDVLVTDGRHRLTLTFFNRRGLRRDLHPGAAVLFAGKVESFHGTVQLTNPEVQVGRDVEAFAGALLPVYPATAKLPSWNIARAVHTVLDGLGRLDDPLPDDLRERHRLLGLRDAYAGIHRPAGWPDVTRARARLKWDEALVLQVALARRRAEARRTPTSARVAASDGLLTAFDRRLPFELTAGQREIGGVVSDDLAQTHPMHRLLQGEVGSGKTVVALRAMLAVVDAGGQAALLAPTEVLATQHYRSITAMLGPMAGAGQLGAADTATRVALVTGSQTSAVRRRSLLEAASGEAGIVVGTHALLEENVQFADLGLVVVDEQHRFGVHQRDTLRAKGVQPPHVLVMTATPIPRTVAMTVFGDLEVSSLTELPLGRSPIRTFVVPDDNASWLQRMWGRVRDEVAAGHQAFVVCPRIGDGGLGDGGLGDGGLGDGGLGEDGLGDGGLGDDDDDEVGDDGAAGDDGNGPPERSRPSSAVLEVLPLLADGELAGLRVAALHGRLSGEDKDDVMRRFTVGDLDVLVATTVVEVGVDVPNATVMVVLDADRFGVSQLHQLRGRIGRGSAPGWCLLHSGAAPGTAPRERLDAVAATLDGFELARLDLEQRREGDVLGATQSGSRSSLRMLTLTRDEDLIREAREEATAIVERDPDLRAHPVLAAQLAAALDPERAEYLAKA